MSVEHASILLSSLSWGWRLFCGDGDELSIEENQKKNEIQEVGTQLYDMWNMIDTCLLRMVIASEIGMMSIIMNLIQLLKRII